MTSLQQEKEHLVISDLRSGVDMLINSSLLPSETVEISTLSNDAGAHVADPPASWVKKGLVSGPYVSPSVEGFRSNRLFVAKRLGKYRPILDLSAPEGSSFNDSIDPLRIPLIKMASLRAIAGQPLDWGKDAHLSKLDMHAVPGLYLPW